MADVARLAIQVDTQGVQKARQALAGLQDGSIKARQATDNLAKSTGGRLRNSFRAARGQSAQFGQQIQDVAIQAQAGTSAFTILGQQGAQVASIFGPGGAALGAILAIGSALSGVLYTSLTGATESADKLLDKMKELTNEFEDATEAQRVFASQEFRSKLEKQNSAISQRRERLQEAREELERLRELQGQRFRATEGPVGIEPIDQEAVSRQISEQRSEVIKLEAALDTAEKQAQKYREQINEVLNPQEKLTDAQEEAQQTVSELVQSTTEQANALGKSDRALALQEARLNGATQAQLLWINANFDAIEAYEQQQKEAQELRQQLKLNRKEYDQSATALDQLRNRLDPASESLKQTRQGLATVTEAFSRGLLTQEEADRLVSRLGQVEESYASVLNTVASLQGADFQSSFQMLGDVFKEMGENQIATFSAVGSAFDNLTQILEKGGEDQFQAYKRMAQAQAAISASLAFLKVLSSPQIPYPANIALAGSIAGLAAVQVAAIDQQEYQGGRAMGGSVSAGESYLVGERGPEVVTMGSQGGYVTPNHAMQGGGANVTQVFQLSDNARREAKQQILESAPMIRNMAKQAVLEAAQNGGAMSRTVGRRS